MASFTSGARKGTTIVSWFVVRRRADVLRAGDLCSLKFSKSGRELLLCRRLSCCYSVMYGCIANGGSEGALSGRESEASTLELALDPSLLYHHTHSQAHTSLEGRSRSCSLRLFSLRRHEHKPAFFPVRHGPHPPSGVRRGAAGAGGRLNAGTRGCFCLSGFTVMPLMYGACMGHDAATKKKAHSAGQPGVDQSILLIFSSPSSPLYINTDTPYRVEWDQGRPGAWAIKAINLAKSRP